MRRITEYFDGSCRFAFVSSGLSSVFTAIRNSDVFIVAEEYNFLRVSECISFRAEKVYAAAMIYQQISFRRYTPVHVSRSISVGYNVRNYVNRIPSIPTLRQDSAMLTICVMSQYSHP